MAGKISQEMRRLTKKWEAGGGWPKRLNWLEPSGVRGWQGQRLAFDFPIVAIVGENGSGKSTLLQAAACTYQIDKPGRTWYPSEFFPDTAWDRVTGSALRYGYSEGGQHKTGHVRKLTDRWLGQVERPQRVVQYIDLNRIQPVGARVGYARIAKTKHTERSATDFDDNQIQRLSEVMGRQYDSAKMAISSVDENREVPVLSRQGIAYSGYHQGSGETTVAELLQADLPKYGLILIDEIESSLHPRAQRRLIRDLAERCRERELQIVLTTHSPYVLEELPLAARMYIMETGSKKEIVPGVSPQFAMTKMDDEQHPDCDVYVEDEAAKTLVAEILARHGKQVFPRCQIIPFGAANVGQALGQMAALKRFPRPSVVFLDGDNAASIGCSLLPGDDAPEQIVFRELKKKRYGEVWLRIGRDSSVVEDELNKAMALSDHHDWVRHGANQLLCGGETLWQAMCAEWAQKCLSAEEASRVVQAVADVLD